MFSGRRRFDDAELTRLGLMMDAVYDDFVAKVAAGRGMSVEEVHAIAKGRIWSGADATGNGLVDHLGGLRDAARIARERAGLRADARVRPAVHVPLAGRLGSPKNSEDPRAAQAIAVPGDLETLVGLPAAVQPLLMPVMRLT
jgi:protease-4